MTAPTRDNAPRQRGEVGKPQQQHANHSTQNRPAPAYQEYAASMMSRIEYRTLTLAQRGLLYTMRLECWVNHGLPEHTTTLARVLGYDAAEIAAELPSVMPFFAVEDGEIVCPELENYRSYIENVRTRQSDAAKATNEKRWSQKSRASTGNSGRVAERVGKRSVSDRSSDRSLVQSSQVQTSPAQPRERGFSEVVHSTEVEGWGDFTQDPEVDQ